MLRKTSFIAYTAITLFGISSIIWTLLPTTTSIAPTLSSNLFQESHHHRYNISKDLWLINEYGNRIHHHITGTSSIIETQSTPTGIQYIENISDIQCFLQENPHHSENSTYDIRYIRSPQGSYNYQSHLFHAQTVDFSLYTLPSSARFTDLPHYNPSLKGQLHTISVSFEKGTPSIRANSINATTQASIKHPLINH